MESIHVSRTLVPGKKILAEIVIDRASRANSLDGKALREMIQAVRTLKREGCDLLVLGGRGRHFCSGLDLGEFLKPKAQRRDSLKRMEELFTHLVRFPAPTLALVQGSVAGGGVVICACADFTVAREGTTFALTETSLGFASGMTYPFLLRRMNLNTLNRLILLRERVAARELLNGGFLLDVWKKEEFADLSRDLLGRMLQGDGESQREYKKFLGKFSEYRFPQEKLLERGRKTLFQTSERDRVKERIASFLENRPLPREEVRLPESWSWDFGD